MLYLLKQNKRGYNSLNTQYTPIRIGKITKVFILFAIIGQLCILYLTNTNNMAIKGFNINQLEQNRIALNKENEKLKSVLNEEKSIDSIKNATYVKKMIPINEYIIIEKKQTAKK